MTEKRYFIIDVEDNDYDSAEIIDIVRSELDKIYHKYLWKGD